MIDIDVWVMNWANCNATCAAFNKTCSWSKSDEMILGQLIVMNSKFFIWLAWISIYAFLKLSERLENKMTCFPLFSAQNSNSINKPGKWQKNVSFKVPMIVLEERRTVGINTFILWNRSLMTGRCLIFICTHRHFSGIWRTWLVRTVRCSHCSVWTQRSSEQRTRLFAVRWTLPTIIMNKE